MTIQVLTVTEARAICQKFANDHKLIFEDEGEVGFGRECVGFLSSTGNYVNYNPHAYPNFDPVWPEDEELRPPEGVSDAYHKHNCMAVLAPDKCYEDAIIQLAAWVKGWEALGQIEIANFDTGATGIQAIVTGVVDKAVRIKRTTQTS